MSKKEVKIDSSETYKEEEKKKCHTPSTCYRFFILFIITYLVLSWVLVMLFV